MQQILTGGILAFFLTFMVIPVIILVAKKKKLYDEPDDTRKLHKQPIPSLGGLGMFIGLILSILLTINFSKSAPEFQYYIAAMLLIFFLGIKDDIMIISPGKKFMGQLITAGILIFKTDLLINNMQGFLGFNQIPAEAAHLLTVFSIVVIINAFNLIDGVDGLAGGLGLISSFVFGIFFMVNGNIPYAVLAFTFSCSLLAFLYYNFHPAKIFMGDTGSMMIGLINAILVIKFIQTGSTYKNYPVTAAPAIGFGILFLPLMDTLRVFGLRIINGRSPFSPDRTHIHHLLLNRGFNHKQVTLLCVGISITISAISFYFQGIGTGLLILLLGGIFFTLVYLLHFKKYTYKLRVIKGDMPIAPEGGDVRLVPLYEPKTAMVEEE